MSLHPPKPAVALIWDDATRLGGVNTWLYQCVDRLPARGLDAWIVDLGASESGQLDVSRWRHRILTLRRGPWESAAGFRRRLRRALLSRDVSVVLFQENRFAEDVLDALPAGFPAANVLHIDRPDARYWEIARALDPVLDEHLCVSPRILEKLQALLPPERLDRAHYLPLGVALPPPAPPRVLRPGETVRLVYAGRLAQEQKRILDLAEFARALAAAGVAHQIDVYGSGPDAPALRAATLTEQTAGTVVLHGSRPQEEILASLSDAHFLLLFSDFEGLPLVLLEAMARGALPLVTRIRSGISDVLEDGVNAFLFPVGAPVAAADLARGLLDRPDAYAAAVRAARQTVEGFDLETCLDAYAAHLARLSARAPALAGQPSRAARRPGLSLKQRLSDHLPRWWTERRA